MPTYANPSNMTTVLYGTSGSAGHDLFYGGGTGWAYATNTHRFFTTANQTTGTGTERLRIASAGQLGIGGANYGTSGQVLTSAGSGSAPTWATPAAATNSPAFSAYRTGDYTAGNGSESILQFNNERFDTDGLYNTGNYRFTPNVAGNYVFYLNFYWFGSTTSNMLMSAFARIKKNGSTTIGTFWIDPNDSYRENRLGMSITAGTDMNGSSDYVEAYGYGLTGAGDPRFAADGAVFGGFKLI